MNHIRKQLNDIPVNFDQTIIDKFDSRAPIFNIGL
jgi:hypothetical protein